MTIEKRDYYNYDKISEWLSLHPVEMTIEKRDYYNHGGIEAIDAIESACTGLTGYEGFLTGTCLKYLCRWKWKGTPLADLKKARYYLDRLITEQENANK